MPRRSRKGLGGNVLHVINRAVRRGTLFETTDDYRAFQSLLGDAVERRPIRLLAYCVMPNHWHLVVWPENDDDLSGFMHWLTTTHGVRWHRARDSAGTGALYQSRYKAIPVQAGQHFLTVCRYVERNALRAGLVRRAEDWRWTSAWRGRNKCDTPKLSPWPVLRPSGWIDLLNEPQSEAELHEIREAMKKNRPIGDSAWLIEAAKCLGIEHPARPRGRPKGHPKSGGRI